MPLRVKCAVWVWRAAIALLAAWLLCRVLTDRFHWSQYLFWAPPESVGAIAVVMWLSARALAGRRYGGGGRTAAGAREARIAAVLASVILAVMLWDWRVWRFALPAGTARGQSLRVMHWNPSDPSLKQLTGLVLAEKPDILFLTDPPWGVDWNALRDRIGGTEGPVTAPESPGAGDAAPATPPEGQAHAGPRSRPTASAIRFGYLAQLVVFSRYPVIRWGGTQLDIRGVNNRFFGIGPETRGPIYPGVALFAELDTTAVLGRPIVVWFVDMPSDVRVWRRSMMEDAARTLAGDNAVCSVRGSRGQDIAEQGKKPFPPPDLIVGDFNTPRGSESLRRLVGDMQEAYDEAGRGGCRTYPRWLPLTPIDHIFLAPWLRAETYGVMNPGVGRHRYQVCTVGTK